MDLVSSNPILIALINMTVVFSVLYGLSLVIRLIKFIDPTNKKKTAQSEPVQSLNTTLLAPCTAIQEEDYDEMIILFTAAIAAYGHHNVKVVAIRPVGGMTWSQTASMEGVHGRNKIF